MSIDRGILRRRDEPWLAQAWSDPDSRALVVDDGQVLVLEGEQGVRLALLPTAQAPDGLRMLLGTDGERAHWAVAAELPALDGARPAGIREVAALLRPGERALLFHAVALSNWHAAHPRCPRCGGPTDPVLAGAARRCAADGSEHFPRSDPAIIVLVHDGADRCVLARQHRWPPRRFSIVAGFVEPGESAEQALEREVGEEIGLAVADLHYAGSQPWPFPSSLMLGYTARARDPSQPLILDDDELAEARWFSRDQVAAALAAGDRGTDELRLPPPASIAWRIISGWVSAAP